MTSSNERERCTRKINRWSQKCQGTLSPSKKIFRNVSLIRCFVSWERGGTEMRRTPTDPSMSVRKFWSAMFRPSLGTTYNVLLGAINKPPFWGSVVFVPVLDAPFYFSIEILPLWFKNFGVHRMPATTVVDERLCLILELHIPVVCIIKPVKRHDVSPLLPPRLSPFLHSSIVSGIHYQSHT